MFVIWFTDAVGVAMFATILTTEVDTPLTAVVIDVAEDVAGHSSRTALRHSHEMSAVGARLRIQATYSSTLSSSKASRARS